MKAAGKHLLKFLIVYLVFSFSFVAIIPQRSLAYVAVSDELSYSRQQDMERIQRVLESKVVADRLEMLGMSTEEINSRLDRLTDEELHSFATQAEHLYPGGSVLLGIIAVAALILLVMYLTGHRLVVERP